MIFLRLSWDYGSFSSKGHDKPDGLSYIPFDMSVEEKPSEWLHFAWIFLLQHVITYQKCEHISLSFHKLNLKWLTGFNKMLF